MGLFCFDPSSWTIIMQLLTVCRFGAEWVVRDVTGEIYGRSRDIRNTFDTAQRMARCIGAQVEFSSEADARYKAVMASQAIDSGNQTTPKSARRFRTLISRFVRRRGGNEANS